MNCKQVSQPLIRMAFKALSLAVLACAGVAAFTPQVCAGVSMGIDISVSAPPPPLPMYEQPIIPGPGYLWTPGYWAWDSDISDYYWVPGTWVLAPYHGALWTPGYWGWDGEVYVFHVGYWARHVGFYGGINYGFGYTGVGYMGGYWGPGGFYYNQTVNHITHVNVTNVYRQTVINNHVTVNRVSYNGGQGGVQLRPASQQMNYAHEQRMAPLVEQMQQQDMAMARPALRASANHGQPPIVATPRPGAFEAFAASLPQGGVRGDGSAMATNGNAMGRPSAVYAHGQPGMPARVGRRVEPLASELPLPYQAASQVPLADAQPHTLDENRELSRAEGKHGVPDPSIQQISDHAARIRAIEGVQSQPYRAHESGQHHMAEHSPQRQIYRLENRWDQERYRAPPLRPQERAAPASHSGRGHHSLEARR